MAEDAQSIDNLAAGLAPVRVQRRSAAPGQARRLTLAKRTFDKCGIDASFGKCTVAEDFLV